MIVAVTAEKILRACQGNLHDATHLLKVYAYAKTIGQLEGLAPDPLQTLELTALVHDIACPLCREKYGSVSGDLQELESPPLIRSFFADLPVEPKQVERISWIVAHHHTYGLSDAPDYQILLEADYLVNAEEKGLSREAVSAARDRIFRTETGRTLLTSLFCL